MYSYQNLFVDAEVFENNEYFTQYYQPYLSHSANHNFMMIKFSPHLEVFQQLEEWQKDFHEDVDMNFVKFYWPEDEGIFPDTFEYLAEENYKLSQTILMVADQSLKKLEISKDIQIKMLSFETLEDFQAMNYADEIRYGEKFAIDKKEYYKNYINHPKVRVLLAFRNEILLGSTHLIEENDTLEIDQLYVKDEYRNQGVASTLQAKIFELAGQRDVILIADAEDTVIDMYEKQGYKKISRRIGIEKNI